jgi:2-dehydropantoate 2-reductase
VLNAVPNTKETNDRYEWIVLATKNIPDVPPSLVEIIAPAVSQGTTIVLLQNGLNIERPFIQRFPQNPVLSGVSLIGAAEPEQGYIVQDDADRLIISSFRSPNLASHITKDAANKFVEIYGKGGRTKVWYEEDVALVRWRKLVYNACLNPICAITGLDTGRIRLADGAVEGLVKPAMEEIRAAAGAAGVKLPEDIAETMINVDSMEIFLKPSMQMDIIKVTFI